MVLETYMIIACFQVVWISSSWYFDNTDKCGGGNGEAKRQTGHVMQLFHTKRIQEIEGATMLRSEGYVPTLLNKLHAVGLVSSREIGSKLVQVSSMIRRLHAWITLWIVWHTLKLSKLVAKRYNQGKGVLMIHSSIW